MPRIDALDYGSSLEFCFRGESYFLEVVVFSVFEPPKFLELVSFIVSYNFCGRTILASKRAVTGVVCYFGMPCCLARGDGERPRGIVGLFSNFLGGETIGSGDFKDSDGFWVKGCFSDCFGLNGCEIFWFDVRKIFSCALNTVPLTFCGV